VIEIDWDWRISAVSVTAAAAGGTDEQLATLADDVDRAAVVP
jgi:hypothetical protein